ncbi:MAG: sigma-70 family RNA polymerase sigma factor [Planctomycetales bacterium]|nr:sigma-70 family RNA polymerase sigma factor [Planctomycetales bacterium]
MTSDSAKQIVEHFFRHESANPIAVLARAFGLRRIELIEETVQAVMLEAMQAWPKSGLPENPAAWIHRVARNRIIDVLRREKVFQHAVTQLGQSVESQSSLVDHWLEEDQIADSLLRTIFVCCYPSLDRKSQIALTLKTLCGFSIAEIARGLLLPTETVKKRVQRARTFLATANVTLQLPDSDQLVDRLDIVHQVLYLLFNEGYSTTDRTEPVRDDICEEAVRLTHLLCESSYGSQETKALLALMLFHSSRLSARVDDEGAVILLEDQDRSKWDRRLICQGQYWLAESKVKQPTSHHLQAGIAMLHCIAPSVKETNWIAIAQLYGQLRQQQDSPLYALNQAIAIGESGDKTTALEQLKSLQAHKTLAHYHILDCAIARIHEQNGNSELAIASYKAAMQKDPAPHELDLLKRKIAKLKKT